MTMRLSDVLRRLRENGYKVTPQRRLIIEVFLQNADRHLSAEETYDIVREESPDLGLATVYRTLDLLAELNVVQRINFGDGRDRYELSESISHHHHHHLICKECGEVYEFEEDLLEELEEAIAAESGFEILDHQVKFIGICASCQEKAEEEGS